MNETASGVFVLDNRNVTSLSYVDAGGRCIEFRLLDDQAEGDTTGTRRARRRES